MAMLFTVVQLLLEIIAARNAVADISAVNTTCTENLVKSFAEGSIHTEPSDMLLNNTSTVY